MLLLLGVLGIVLAPQPARAIDLPWEMEFLNPDNYRDWSVRPQTSSVDNADWRVQLSNASCAVPIHLDASGFVGEHDIYASVELCTTADFEIEFKKANWSSSTVDTDITKNYRLYSMEIFDTSSLNQLVGYIPFVGNLAGVTFNKKIVGAATAPCVVKGRFSVKAVYKIGYDDNEVSSTPTAWPGRTTRPTFRSPPSTRRAAAGTRTSPCSWATTSGWTPDLARWASGYTTLMSSSLDR